MSILKTDINVDKIWIISIDFTLLTKNTPELAQGWLGPGVVWV